MCWMGVRAVFRVLKVPRESWNQRKESLIFLIFIYLAVGPSCGTWDLRSSLQHVGSLVIACKHTVDAWRI